MGSFFLHYEIVHEAHMKVKKTITITQSSEFIKKAKLEQISSTSDSRSSREKPIVESETISFNVSETLAW